jgi:hypothetical protein
MANIFAPQLIPSNLILEAKRSAGTSLLKKATRRNIPEDGILHNDRRDYIKSYIALTGWALYQCNVSPLRYELVFISQDTAFFIVTAIKTSNLT